MTVSEARTIVEQFNRNNGNYTEEDFFLYTEAAGFLIRETNDPRIMLNLGGFYYEQKNYDLALKYYTMAAEHGYEEAEVCLGYIWYYGRTETIDYEKAFHYFSMARQNPVAEYKIADMYHNGYYVEKDGMWNVFSTVVDDFLYSDFMTFDELKALVVGEVVVDKLNDLETLLTDKPILNRMPYEMATELVRERKNDERYNIDAE